MANYQYSADIIADALFRAGEPTDGSSDYADEAIVLLNRAYEQVYVGGSEIEPTVCEDWRWLRSDPPGVLIILPPVTDGTVAVTKGSTSVTFSTGPTLDSDGWFLRTTGQPDIARISAHTAASTSATLDAVWTNDTDTAATYTLFKATYELATDLLRLVSPFRVYRPSPLMDYDYQVGGMGINPIDRTFPLTMVESGVPDSYNMVGERTVRFNRYGGPETDTYIRAEYDYLFRPCPLTGGASEEPYLPLHRRRILSDLLCAYILGAKNDDRSVAVFELAKRGLVGMSVENRKVMQNISRNYFQLQPRQTSRYRTVLRTESGAVIG